MEVKKEITFGGRRVFKSFWQKAGLCVNIVLIVLADCLKGNGIFHC